MKRVDWTELAMHTVPWICALLAMTSTLAVLLHTSASCVR